MGKMRMTDRRLMIIGALMLAVVATDPGARAQQDMFDTGLAKEEPAARLVQVYSVISYSELRPGETYPAAAVVSIVPEWHINSSAPYQDWLIPAELTFDSLPQATPHGIVYPVGGEAFLLEEKMSVYDGRVIVYFQVTVAADAAPGDVILPVQFTYQPCNDKECRPPETTDADLRFSIGEGGQPIEADIFAGLDLEQTGPDESGGTLVGEQSELQRLIDTYGFWGYLIAFGLAFVTGLALSFSPCTYPMIPITVSIFAGQERSVGRGFILSLFYVTSMAVMYGIMGLVVSLVGGVFGAWLASPAVLIGIAVIFVIFSLSMFGLFEIQVPSALRQKLGAKQRGGGVPGVIVLGVVAALVVSPCVGPFVAGILLYIATHGSPVIGFLVLFIFALGLGTFYVIIGTFSTAVNKLPRAGEWMESVKKFFGFVLLLMALYFLRPVISSSLVAVLAGLLLLALGIFGGGLDRLAPDSSFFHRLKKFVGFIALLFGVYFLMGSVIMHGVLLPPASRWLPVSGSGTESGHDELIPWQTDLDTGLARARAEGRPVVIDTWATWCANCRVLDKKTFGNPEVAAEARRFVPLRIQLEKANSPETKAFMERFGMKLYSLPTVLLLDSTGQARAVLKGVVGPREMLAEMRKVH